MRSNVQRTPAFRSFKPKRSLTGQVAQEAPKPQKKGLINSSLVKGLGLLSLTGGGLLAYTAWEEEGVRRSLYFWRRMFPIYLTYRWTEWRVSKLSDEEQASFSELAAGD